MAGTLIVSLDFELFWGMQDCTTIQEYGENILGGRNAIPRLLDMLKKYGIHATWATVGFMFAENADELKDYIPDNKPSYNSTALSSYRCLQNIANDKESSQYFYAPSVIQKISETPGQEIASHTFSHYYCREKGQTTDQFREDMKAAKKIAANHGYDLTSVVLPRNQCEAEYTEVLKELGFTAYRDEENDWIHEKINFVPLKRILRLADVYIPLTGQGGYIPEDEKGIMNLTGSRMYKPIFKPLRFLEGLKIHRIKKQMLHAAKNNLTFHLWWHPHNIGIMTEEHFKQLTEIFEYYIELKNKYGMNSKNMREAAE